MGGIPEYGADATRTYQRAIFDWVNSGRTIVMTTRRCPKKASTLACTRSVAPMRSIPAS